MTHEGFHIFGYNRIYDDFIIFLAEGAFFKNYAILTIATNNLGLTF